MMSNRKFYYSFDLLSHTLETSVYFIKGTCNKNDTAYINKAYYILFILLFSICSHVQHCIGFLITIVLEAIRIKSWTYWRIHYIRRLLVSSRSPFNQRSKKHTRKDSMTGALQTFALLTSALL